MISYRIHIVLMVLLMSFTVLAGAQDNADISVEWVKKTQLIKPNGFYFNVLRIENSSNEAKLLDLTIEYPDDLKALTRVPVSVNIDAKSKKSIPLRLSPSKSIQVDSLYQVNAVIKYNNQNYKAISEFNIAGVHDVKLIVHDRSLAFNPGQELVNLNVSLFNNGNYTENVEFDLQLSEELVLDERKQRMFTEQISPQQQLDFEIPVKYKNTYNNTSFTSAWIEVSIVAVEKQETKKVIVTKLESTFDNFQDRRVADNTIEYFASHNVGFGMSSSVRASGRVKTEKGEIDYGAQLRNVFGQSYEDFLDNNFFELSYQGRDIAYGLGTSSFQGLSGLFKRNSLFIDKSFNLNDKNRFNVFANEAINRFDLGLAAGHEFISKTFNTSNSIGWNYNEELRNQSIILENTTSVYLKNLFANFRGNYTQNDDESGYLTGYRYLHNFRMDADFLDEKLNFDLTHKLSSQERNNGNTFSSYLYSNLRYALNDKGLQAILRYSNSNLKQNLIARESDYNANVLRAQFVIPLAYRLKLTSGVQAGSYRNLINAENLYTEKNASLFSDIRYSGAKFYGRSSLQYGMKKLNSLDETLGVLSSNTEFELMTSKTSNIFGEVNYTTGATRTFSSNNETELDAQLGIKQSIFGEKNYLTLAAFYRDTPYSSSSPLSMRAGVNVWTPGNFNLNLNVGVKSASGGKGVALSNVEARVTKHFNWKDKDKTFYDLSLEFFKDENGNEMVDVGEDQISGIKVSVTQLSTNARNERSAEIASLVSAGNGIVKYKNLPAGRYAIHYFPIVDLNGYYNFEEKELTVDLAGDLKLAKPFSKAGKIYGAIKLMRSQFSSLGGVDISNIRISAISETGKEFSTLTDRYGNFTIYLPDNQKYTLSLKNVFGDKFSIQQNDVEIDLNTSNDYEFNFNVSEKKRKINFSK